MIKRICGILATAALLASCGGYTEEQGKAADMFCECMDAQPPSDSELAQEILWFECEIKLVEEHGGEVMTDEGFSTALEEKCSDVAALIQDSE